MHGLMGRSRVSGFPPVGKPRRHSLSPSGAIMSTSFVLNGAPTTLDADPAMPLLWAIREVAGLPGTKFGCGMALCGACTVHLEGEPVRSCVMPLTAVAGKHVLTIEGLRGAPAKAVQAAWIQLQVPQCGYCQSGQIMSATALLEKNPAPSDADIDGAMSGNICRCATYSRIRGAIHAAASALAAAESLKARA
jgi:isoquinoline 1-oxidoreductase alpha subunit